MPTTISSDILSSFPQYSAVFDLLDSQSKNITHLQTQHAAKQRQYNEQMEALKKQIQQMPNSIEENVLARQLITQNISQLEQKIQQEELRIAILQTQLDALREQAADALHYDNSHFIKSNDLKDAVIAALTVSAKTYFEQIKNYKKERLAFDAKFGLIATIGGTENNPELIINHELKTKRIEQIALIANTTYTTANGYRSRRALTETMTAILMHPNLKNAFTLDSTTPKSWFRWADASLSRSCYNTDGLHKEIKTLTSDILCQPQRYTVIDQELEKIKADADEQAKATAEAQRIETDIIHRVISIQTRCEKMQASFDSTKNIVRDTKSRAEKLGINYESPSSKLKTSTAISATLQTMKESVASIKQISDYLVKNNENEMKAVKTLPQLTELHTKVLAKYSAAISLAKIFKRNTANMTQHNDEKLFAVVAQERANASAAETAARAANEVAARAATIAAQTAENEAKEKAHNDALTKAALSTIALLKNYDKWNKAVKGTGGTFSKIANKKLPRGIAEMVDKIPNELTVLTARKFLVDIKQIAKKATERKTTLFCCINLRHPEVTALYELVSGHAQSNKIDDLNIMNSELDQMTKPQPRIVAR